MTRAHSWYLIKRFPWPVCKCCGLVRLKNHATEIAVRRHCDGRDDA